MYSETSLSRPLWELNFSPYYRGVLNTEVVLYTSVLHWDTEWCPYYRGFHILEVCNREVPLCTSFTESQPHWVQYFYSIFSVAIQD